MRITSSLGESTCGTLLALAVTAATSHAAPLAPVRSIPIPAPDVDGLAYSSGQLWLTGSMGPGMVSLLQMAPDGSSVEFLPFAPVDVEVLEHDGTNFFSTRDAGSWSCDVANPNRILTLSGAGAVLADNSHPAASRPGGLAALNGSLWAAGLFDADPCDATPGVTSLVKTDPATGSVLDAVDVTALGDAPGALTSNGTHLLYGAWAATALPSTFALQIHALDESGNVIDTQVLYEVIAADVAMANSLVRVGDIAWGADELFVLNFSTLQVDVFALPVAVDEPDPDPDPEPDPEPNSDIALDIMQGDEENCINLKSQGKTDAVLFGSEELDASQLDLASITLAGAPIAYKRNGTYMASVLDVDLDSYADLVLHFETQDFELSEADTEATLTGWTLGGEEFMASDFVKVVHEEGEEVADGSQGRGHGNGLRPSSELGLEGVSFGLGRSWPNPASGSNLQISFALSSGSRASLDLYDIGGRRVHHQSLHLGAGVHQIDLGSRIRLGTGTYFVVLREGSQVSRGKIHIMQ